MVAAALDDPPPEYSPYARLHPVALGVLSGCFTALLATFVKCLGEVAKGPLLYRVASQAHHSLTYGLIVLVIASFLLQVRGGGENCVQLGIRTRMLVDD